jgi:hypothetical protein
MHCEKSLRNTFGFEEEMTCPFAIFVCLFFALAIMVKKLTNMRMMAFFLLNFSWTPSATFSRTLGTNIIQCGW